MFLQIVRDINPTKMIMINTDNVNHIIQTVKGCDFHMIDGSVIETEADYENLIEIIVADEKKKSVTHIDTGTINVKIVNPH